MFEDIATPVQKQKQKPEVVITTNKEANSNQLIETLTKGFKPDEVLTLIEAFYHKKDEVVKLEVPVMLKTFAEMPVNHQKVMVKLLLNAVESLAPEVSKKFGRSMVQKNSAVNAVNIVAVRNFTKQLEKSSRLTEAKYVIINKSANPLPQVSEEQVVMLNKLGVDVIVKRNKLKGNILVLGKYNGVKAYVKGVDILQLSQMPELYATVCNEFPQLKNVLT